MISLAKINNVRAALALVDYLNHVGIESQLDTSEAEAQIILRDANDLEAATEILNDFIRDPEQKKYLLASWQTGDSNVTVSTGPTLSPSLVKSIFFRVGGLTIAIALLCVLVFVALNVATGLDLLSKLSFSHSIEELLQTGEYWRTLTPMLLHFTLPHLIFNLMWWWVFAGDIEKKQSALHLITLTLLTAFFSNLGQFLTTGANFGGLSGVVYGLLGYCWILGRRSPHLGITVHASTMKFMVIWLVLCYTDVVSSIVGPIANTAHTVGLLVGILWGGTLSFFTEPDSPSNSPSNEN
ncbi:MAG: rhomboid family intramembrane serine protease GlpG [Moraxellaceae bacterium]|nr:MAG: rhomboid family intramembrane serine protease GlpG [Moraxellaceae bacterium]